MATDHYAHSSTVAPTRGGQGRTFETLREQLLAGLPVTDRAYIEGLHGQRPTALAGSNVGLA